MVTLINKQMFLELKNWTELWGYSIGDLYNLKAYEQYELV